MTKQEQLIAKRTNAQLISDWTMLDKMPMTQRVATVRGWLMSEIEKRWPSEFEAWVMSDDGILTNYVRL